MSVVTPDNRILDQPVDCECGMILRTSHEHHEIPFAPSTNDAVLLWLCPKCGRARPRYTTGDLGKMAVRYCNAINHDRLWSRSR